MAQSSLDQTGISGAPLARVAWRAGGWAAFGIGCVGLVLPLLPTTIFWIVAVIAFSKSDPAMAARIRAWPGVGAAVADYVDHGIMTRGAKRASLLGMGIAAGLVCVIVPAGPWLFAGLGGLAAGALFVATRPPPPSGRALTRAPPDFSGPGSNLDRSR